MVDELAPNKDDLFFIDERVYNCPFCIRNNVKYRIIEQGSFDWNLEKKAYYYIAQCCDDDCSKKSLHLSFYDLMMRQPTSTKRASQSYIELPEPGLGCFSKVNNAYRTTEDIEIKNGKSNLTLDEIFFYHQPTSFFTIDNRIPKEIRKPLSESENCLRNNFLTGASGCLRKALYKLLKQQAVPEKQGSDFIKYGERIEKLKQKFPNISPEYFNHLKKIHGLTSQELHENEWEDLKSSTITFLHYVLRVILDKIYVEPQKEQQISDKVRKLNAEANKPRADKTVTSKPDSDNDNKVDDIIK
jgi:hypothetical protein